MDLLERRAGRSNSAPRRHPWEIARARTVASLLRRLPVTPRRVLDVGCGDGYVAGELGAEFSFETLTAQDVHLTDEVVRELTTAGNDANRLKFVCSLEELDAEPFDLILMLDVLEHIKDDRAFLSEVVARHLSPGGSVLVTVPTFQGLFSQHDRDLLHERRYRRSDAESVAHGAGLEVIDSGYVFASLVPPRAFAVALERIFPPHSRSTPGVAGWRFGRAVTAPLALALWLDARSMLLAHDWGVDLPGLSCWMICTRR